MCVSGDGDKEKTTGEHLWFDRRELNYQRTIDVASTTVHQLEVPSTVVDNVLQFHVERPCHVIGQNESCFHCAKQSLGTVSCFFNHVPYEMAGGSSAYSHETDYSCHGNSNCLCQRSFPFTFHPGYCCCCNLTTISDAKTEGRCFCVCQEAFKCDNRCIPTNSRACHPNSQSQLSEDCGREITRTPKDTFHCMTSSRLDRRSTCVEKGNTIVGKSREGSKCVAKTATVGSTTLTADRFLTPFLHADIAGVRQLLILFLLLSIVVALPSIIYQLSVLNWAHKDDNYGSLAIKSNRLKTPDTATSILGVMAAFLDDKWDDSEILSLDTRNVVEMEEGERSSCSYNILRYLF